MYIFDHVLFNWMNDNVHINFHDIIFNIMKIIQPLLDNEFDEYFNKIIKFKDTMNKYK